jgi:hypothetical protein
MSEGKPLAHPKTLEDGGKIAPEVPTPDASALQIPKFMNAQLFFSMHRGLARYAKGA